MTLKQSHDLKQSSEFIKVKSLVGAECGESRTLRSVGEREEMPGLPDQNASVTSGERRSKKSKIFDDT